MVEGIMMIETFEKKVLEEADKSIGETNKKRLNKSFENLLSTEDRMFDSPFDNTVNRNIAQWLGVDEKMLLQKDTSGIYDTFKRMYSGVDENGVKTRGLKQIHKMKVNPDFKYQNLKQQSGFSAEVISTAKENLKAQLEKTGITTYRADDLPDLFPKNDQFVDKVRMNQQGDIIERIQTKFIGEDAKQCLDKMMTKKFDKYLDSGKVDKIEIPKDFYDKIAEEKMIINKREKITNQLNHAKERNDAKLTQKYTERLNKLNKLDSMLERSTVTSDEALYARKHPKRYVAKNFLKENIKAGHKSFEKAGLSSAMITASMSTVDNVKKVFDGKISPTEAIANVAKETGASGVIGYGTEFISTTVGNRMLQSGHKLIRSLGKCSVPAAVVSFGVDSFDSVVDFAQGQIGFEELAKDLGGSATGVAGGVAGGAAAGAILGSVVPGAGTVVGAGVGLVGSMIGYAVSTEAYQTALELGENASELIDQAKKYASETLNTATEFVGEQAESLKASINGFAKEFGLPFQL